MFGSREFRTIFKLAPKGIWGPCNNRLCVLLVFAMKCFTNMPCLMPHNRYCCLLSSPMYLPHLLICTCLISSPVACPPSSCVLCWCLLRFVTDVFSCLPRFFSCAGCVSNHDSWSHYFCLCIKLFLFTGNYCICSPYSMCCCLISYFYFYTLIYRWCVFNNSGYVIKPPQPSSATYGTLPFKENAKALRHNTPSIKRILQCKVRSLIHRVKCNCSVQRIGTNTYNLTALKSTKPYLPWESEPDFSRRTFFNECEVRA